MARKGQFGHIRPLVEEDVPQVASLFMRTFDFRGVYSQQRVEAYFTEILFHNPWYDETMPSLAYQDDGGRVVGCLGVMPRRMSLRGRPVQVAISHHFMVEPSSRRTLAAVQLLKTFLSGVQELSLAEGNELSHKVWMGVGGKTALLYSLRWIRPLRPCRYVLSLLERRQLLVPFARAISPLCRMLDTVAVRLPASPFHQLEPSVEETELGEATLLSCLSAFPREQALRPEYDDLSLKWLVDILAQKHSLGRLRKRLICDSGKNILGWYLYYLKPGDVSEVVQIGASDTSLDKVLDHLLYDAWQQGTLALAGRLEPRLMQGLGAKYAVFTQAGFWMLVHSQNPELLYAISSGDAFLTRLEGEWWIDFRG
jgi:hypothetical protein